MTHIDELRKIYLDHLGEQVPYDFKLRPRVRYVQKWKDLLESPPLCNRLDQLDTDRVWVWSDLHFGHKNIIDFSNRPYVTVDEMNEDLVFRFNQCVGPNDTSIWVGDVAFMNDTDANAIIDQCNGYKILITGNHDFNHKKLKKLNFDEQYLFFTYETFDVQLMFTHYPITDNKLPWPWINIHGHIHVGARGKYVDPISDQHINVNCEYHEYKPIKLSQIEQWAKSRVISHE